MDILVFSFIFAVQVGFWIFLNFIRAGKIISAIWGSITLIGFMTTIWYPSYLEAWRIGLSGNIVAMGDLIEVFLTNSIYFLIQFVIPPWAGFLVGLYADRGNVSYGGSAI